MCQGPEVGVCLAGLRIRQESRVTGVSKGKSGGGEADREGEVHVGPCSHAGLHSGSHWRVFEQRCYDLAYNKGFLWFPGGGSLSMYRGGCQEPHE